MENYSLLMGAAAVMKMAVEMAAVSMEKPSGALPRSGRVPEQRLCPPDLGFAMAAAAELSTADARKALFEELLWEHRNLAEAHNNCQAIPEASIEALKDQVAALQAEKEQLIRDHQKALDAQKEISRELKDQAMQAGVRHAEELKLLRRPGLTRRWRMLATPMWCCRPSWKSAKALKTAEGKAAKAHKAAAEEATGQKAAGLFPDSQAHAIKKVAEHRAQQAGNNLGAPWDPYDHLVALNARVSHMRSVDRNLSDIPEVASQLFKTLWPGEVVPDTFSLISDRLKGACRRIREWQCSAARAGADSALRVACSWSGSGRSSACVKALPLMWTRFLPL
ncbi:hypothetical protein QYE76_057561 [Lolium multiflorum]|uniref:Uncharacterized protein n=1 Tax=Lolium multiflorum TaxID=4521 RepID=A0AAD8T3L9_LOLMU|nr:hypothetical protein QYE76_057561 [Lolium multiflorum]